MAYAAGKDTYFTFNLVNLTSSLASEVRTAMSRDALEASTIGNAWKRFLEGQAGAQITVSGVWDGGTAVTNLDGLFYTNMNNGGTKLLEVMPEGSASSRILYKANGFVTAYEISAPVGDKVGFSATIQVADTPIRSISA